VERGGVIRDFVSWTAKTQLSLLSLKLESHEATLHQLVALVLKRHTTSLHLESCTPGIWWYKAACSGTSRYVRFWRHGGTKNLKMVCTRMYWHRKFLGPYVPGCSGMYCPVLSWYKVVQGGTRWYMTVQGTVYGGTRWYMAVQESVKLYILVCTTYLFLRFNLDPAGLAAAMLPCRRRCIKDQCI
jgi:hypothetical protein